MWIRKWTENQHFYSYSSFSPLHNDLTQSKRHNLHELGQINYAKTLRIDRSSVSSVNTTLTPDPLLLPLKMTFTSSCDPIHLSCFAAEIVWENLVAGSLGESHVVGSPAGNALGRSALCITQNMRPCYTVHLMQEVFDHILLTIFWKLYWYAKNIYWFFQGERQGRCQHSAHRPAKPFNTRRGEGWGGKRGGLFLLLI